MFLYKVVVLFSLGIIVAVFLKMKLNKTHEFEGEMEKFPKHF